MTPAEKFRATMTRKHGSLDEWKREQAINGAKGGKIKVPKGFAIRRDLAVLGGKKSKRKRKDLEA